MRKLFLAAVAAASVTIIVAIAWAVTRRAEPVFEGRPLTVWLNHHVASSAAVPPYGSPGWREADRALRAIGTNAIPTLLEMIQAKDPPPFAGKLLDFAARHGVRFQRRPA